MSFRLPVHPVSNGAPRDSVHADSVWKYVSKCLLQHTFTVPALAASIVALFQNITKLQQCDLPVHTQNTSADVLG